MKERTVRVEVLFSPEEYRMLRDRMTEAGVRSMGPFIRKMALDGYVIKLDTTEIREMTSLLRRCSNNLNQVAKRANSTGSIYGADIAELQNRQEEIWESTKELLARLASIQ